MSREFDAIHDALRAGSESGLGGYCGSSCVPREGDRGAPRGIDLIEDLMRWDRADEVTDRLEILLGDCQGIRESVIEAQVPGNSARLVRFHALQGRLMDAMAGYRW